VKWVTREFVHVDRTACPWLIKKFIDQQAQFIFVPTEKIEEVVKTQGATPFDAPGVKLGHRDGKCSFAEGIGLSAVMTGARFNVKDDFEAVKKAAYVYDALYSYCKFKLLCEKYKDELEKMNRKQQREFLRKKMQEETTS